MELQDLLHLSENLVKIQKLIAEENEIKVRRPRRVRKRNENEVAWN